MVRDFKKLIKNKKILLVANSVEMMKHRKGGNLGRWIDDFPGPVLRFGMGLPVSDTVIDATGRRTDIWVAGAFRLGMWYQYGNTLLKDTFVLFNRNRIHLDKSADRDWENGRRGPGTIRNIPYMDTWSDEELLDIYKEFGYTPNVGNAVRPSSGFLTILWFIRKMKIYKQLHLIGFDAFAKVTEKIRHPNTKSPPFSWHLPISTGEHPHNAPLEKHVLTKLRDDNELKWHILSDLKDEKITYSQWHPLDKRAKK